MTPAIPRTHPVRVERRERGRDRVDARRRAHRHREHVVDEERGAGDEARVASEILAGDDVGAPAPGVGEDRLPERRDHDRDEDRDRERDRQRGAEGRRPGRRQDEQDGLGGVGHRGQGVRGEHGQAGGPAQPFVLVEAGRDRPADEDPLQALNGHRVRQAGPGPGPPWSPRVADHADGVRIARAGPARRRCRTACTPSGTRARAARSARSGACRSRDRSSPTRRRGRSPCGRGT